MNMYSSQSYCISFFYLQIKPFFIWMYSISIAFGVISISFGVISQDYGVNSKDLRR